MKDFNIKEKSLEEQKEIINNYIKKVLIFEDKIDIKYIVDFNGGGGAYQFLSTIALLLYRHKVVSLR